MPALASAVVLTGDLSLNYQDVSADITAFKLSGSRQAVTVPATMGSRVTFDKAGSEEWTIEIGFHQSEEPTSAHKILFDALLTENAQVVFGGQMTDDANSDRYYGTFVCTGITVGGDTYSLGTDSQTYKLTGRPTRTDGSGS